MEHLKCIEAMDFMKDWKTWMSTLHTQIESAEKLGVSEETIKTIGVSVGNFLAEKVCPATKEEELLRLKGVGRKTANLVLGLGYSIPAICVDTHVHRISNRLGWVVTKVPVQTEEALRRIIPRNYWIRLNTIFVAFGQNICLPVSPYCSRCKAAAFCRRIGVKRRR